MNSTASPSGKRNNSTSRDESKRPRVVVPPELSDIISYLKTRDWKVESCNRDLENTDPKFKELCTIAEEKGVKVPYLGDLYLHKRFGGSLGDQSDLTIRRYKGMYTIFIHQYYLSRKVHVLKLLLNGKWKPLKVVVLPTTGSVENYISSLN